MKLKEFVKGLNLMDGYGEVYSDDKEILKKYYNEDCIVAYDKSKIGSIFIVKGKRSNFAFFKLVNELRSYLCNRTLCRRIPLRVAVKLLGKCKVINKEEFKKVKKEVILENLK